MHGGPKLPIGKQAVSDISAKGIVLVDAAIMSTKAASTALLDYKIKKKQNMPENLVRQQLHCDLFKTRHTISYKLAKFQLNRSAIALQSNTVSQGWVAL